MIAPLRTQQLFLEVLKAIDKSGWQCLVLGEAKPFRFRLFCGDSRGIDIRIYIWNCTHGGGAARAQDEYRVQLTGVVPSQSQDEITLLLGWHSGYEVFVGFDILKHDGQSSHSPSIQVKEETLQSAHNNSFSTYVRKNGEIAIAFRPEFLVEYALNAKSLHLTGELGSTEEIALLNKIDDITDADISVIKNETRKTVLTQIVRNYRASDFRKRVLGAYRYSCAACGIQLELVDAAHILPVAEPNSTDETTNGIALCKLHHAAFDRRLISFDENYKIEINESETDRLTTNNLAGGLIVFKKNLKSAIILPNDRRDYPSKEYIKRSREVRNWGKNYSV